MELLRLIAIGNVDDGKSTLIGRLLHDSGAIRDDQWDELERTSERRGRVAVDLSLVTDGLKAEREQGITIDVAHRFFATARRRFILLDAPGHAQYTRNMVTGASHADVALVLVDATKPIEDQTRRHVFLASLLRIRHLVVCVNKMDLVGFAENRFEEIRGELLGLAPRLEIPELVFLPVSAVEGDNVVGKSPRMPWYGGRALLDHLEGVRLAGGAGLADFRCPVQGAIRGPLSRGRESRAFTGRIASGEIHRGDEILVVPSGARSRVRAIICGGREVETARSAQSVALSLSDDIDVARGDMLVPPGRPPRISDTVEAMACWLGDRPLVPGSRLLLRQATREARCAVRLVREGVDMRSLDPIPAPATLAKNDIARLSLKLGSEICYDPYRVNRATGSAILVDEMTGNTVGALMLE